ncbi:mechanosensitive ion channel family protein [Echinicola rosea]|uniref:Mechanosensitive ion channel protein MscS n=2 Tax=Echinicola rosea TaxID=1807691 RepID=A0ABQ1UVA5_9BACT|nr:mechanosensitive ion channel family protein [Echinicola rosea]GGF26693.1 mechanosensitive ion channel protein MscS [Echinicola rosea]
MVFLTNYIHNWLYRKAKNKYPKESPDTILLVKRMLNSLWLLLGGLILSLAYIEKNLYDVVEENFWLIFYLGVVLTTTVVLAALVQTFFSRAIRKRTEMDEGDPTSHKFLRYLTLFGIYFIGTLFAILAFPSLRGVATTALSGAGVITVITGIASKEALANLIGGVFIIIFKPFRVGNVIKITDQLVGTVVDITLRHTVIRDFKNKMIIIPNAIINQEKVTNYNLIDKKICQWIEIGISYDSDIDLAKKIMQEECENHPSSEDCRTFREKEKQVPKVVVRVISLAESAVTLRAWTWTKDYPTAFVMKCDLFECIKKRFEKEGIEIPYPHTKILFKNREPAS